MDSSGWTEAVEPTVMDNLFAIMRVALEAL